MNINKWKKDGNIYLWRYKDNPRNYPGWHITADPDGCASLIRLMDDLLDSPTSANRAVILGPKNTDLYCITGCRQKPIREEKLNIIKSGIIDSWVLKKDNTKLMLEIGEEYIQQFRSGIDGIQHGKGDYCIGDEGQELWFWWYIGN